MKMTFAIPDELSRRFRQSVPSGKRSAVITSMLASKLRPSDQSLAAVCKRVNALEALEDEMAEWEKFDDQQA
jgi:predicted nucleic acid-binding protein